MEQVTVVGAGLAGCEANVAARKKKYSSAIN